MEGIGRQGGAFCGVPFNSVFEVDTRLDPNRLEEYERCVRTYTHWALCGIAQCLIQHSSPFHSNSRDRIWYIASSPLPGTPVQPYRVGIPGIGGQEEPYYDANLFFPEDYFAVQQGSV